MLINVQLGAVFGWLFSPAPEQSQSIHRSIDIAERRMYQHRKTQDLQKHKRMQNGLVEDYEAEKRDPPWGKELRADQSELTHGKSAKFAIEDVVVPHYGLDTSPPTPRWVLTMK